MYSQAFILVDADAEQVSETTTSKLRSQLFSRIPNVYSCQRKSKQLLNISIQATRLDKRSQSYEKIIKSVRTFFICHQTLLVCWLTCIFQLISSGISHTLINCAYLVWLSGLLVVWGMWHSSGKLSHDSINKNTDVQDIVRYDTAPMSVQVNLKVISCYVFCHINMKDVHFLPSFKYFRCKYYDSVVHASWQIHLYYVSYVFLNNDSVLFKSN